MTVSKNHVLSQSLRTGEVLICDFDSGFKPPEMVKKRPVVVVSRTQTHWRNLCTVVPISTTAPDTVEPWHVLLFENPLHGHMPAQHPFGQQQASWVKCDMLYTVAFDRLRRPHTRTFGGRNYSRVSLATESLNAVFKAIYAYLPEPR